MNAIDGFITLPKGFLASGVKAGIKKSGNEDIAIIYSETPAAVGAVFTQNIMASPAVLVSREHAKNDYIKAIVINSGCANACTGDKGFNDAKKMTKVTGELLHCKESDVLVCSTGVIGQFLPMQKIENGIKKAFQNLSKEGGKDAANAIQTTDTFIKKSAYEFFLGDKKIVIAGIAKGSGMIHMNMATMLAFITTDAAIEPKLLKNLTKHVADRTFNMVVVDGDTSTNDSMIVLANGMSENDIIDSVDHPFYKPFLEALMRVSEDLAKLIAVDGEGATKFLTVNVKGLNSFFDAKTIAMSIAKSPLVKTAFFGEDPNWGRIVCAAGYAGVDFKPENVFVYLNNLEVCAKGMNVESDKDKIEDVMRSKDIVLDVIVGTGSEMATVWTCDFSYDYVKINAEYHT